MGLLNLMNPIATLMSNLVHVPHLRNVVTNMTLVNGLRVFWIGLVLWYELGVFTHAVRNCSWPDFDVSSHTSHLPAPSHILLVADPQILDHRSYPDRSSFLTYITRLVVDLNLRKNWRAAMRKKPDAVVFLGDMMDGGRFSMTEEEYEQYYRRFNSIFYLPSGIPAYFLPGNHDIGLKKSTIFSPYAKLRYMTHFGPLNRRVSIANHTIVLLDAPGLVEEDIERQRRGQSFSQWKPVHGGPIEFVNTVAQGRNADPIVLLSHIPLARDDFDCGPLRERGTIRAGVGLGYQNTLGEEVTAFLLNSLEPVVVFSGDDHDYCESKHLIGREESAAIREVTVKSLSMAMGIQQPGFQLLSLFPREYWNATQSTTSHADVPCLLPGQLRIYLSVYAPFFVLSLFLVWISNMPCVVSRSYLSRRRRRTSPLKSRSRSKVQDDNQMSSDDDTNSSFRLPLPASVSSRASRAGRILPSRVPSNRHRLSMTKVLMSIMSSNQNRGLRRRKHKSFVGGFICDVRDIAVFPLVLFLLTSLWTSLS